MAGSLGSLVVDLEEVLEVGAALRHRQRPEVALQVGLGSGVEAVEHPNGLEPASHPSGEDDSALRRGEVGLVAVPPKRKRI